MIKNRRALHVVFAGLFVVASLGLGVSAETETAILDRSSGRVAAEVSTPPASGDTLADYDIETGKDFLVSATPAHLPKVPVVTGDDRDATGTAENAGRNVETDHSAAGHHRTGEFFAEGFTPAQVSGDDAASATEDRSSMTLPIDLTLVPVTYSLAASPRHPFEVPGQPGLFDAGPDDRTNAFQADLANRLDFDAPQSIPPSMDLAYRLYAPLAGPEPTSYALMGLATGGWALPVPPSGR